MLQFTCIGNLGSDAKVQEKDGRKFVAFNVAHTDKWIDQEGKSHETTDWVSCTVNGDGGNILPYLTTGTKVYVEGRGSVRLYSSPKDRMMKAGANINVTRIELVGGTSDPVPSQLYDTSTGEMHSLNKFFYDPDFRKLKFDGDFAYLADRRGRLYAVRNDGFVAPIQNDQTSGNETPANGQQQPGQLQEDAPFTGEEQATQEQSAQKSKSKK